MPITQRITFGTVPSENGSTPFLFDFPDGLVPSVSRRRVALQVSERECTGLWVLSTWRKMCVFVYHLFDEELELFRPCQPLQACHCQLGFCGCVKVLLPCRRTCSRCHSLAFCKSGCLVVAMVHASSSTHLTNVHVLRKRRVLFLVLPQFGPSFFPLRLLPVTEDSVDTMRLSDIVRLVIQL